MLHICTLIKIKPNSFLVFLTWVVSFLHISLNTRNAFSHKTRSWKSEIKVLKGSWEESDPDWWSWEFLGSVAPTSGRLWLHRILFSACSFSSSIRAHELGFGLALILCDLILIASTMTIFPNVYILRSWRLFESLRNIIQPTLIPF